MNQWCAGPLLFRLVTYQYGRGAILITTNKSVRDWTDLLAGDEVIAAAILDRLLHRSHVQNIKGRSYRLVRRGTGPLDRFLTRLTPEDILKKESA